MNLNDDFPMRGRLHIRIFGADGALKTERVLDNLVVTNGKNWAASRLLNAVSNVMSHMAIGTGAVAAALGDVSLGAEAGRVALDSAVGVNNVDTYAATFPAGIATGAITEAGIFNAGAGGTLLARTVFAVLNKGAADYMTISWAITVG